MCRFDINIAIEDNGICARQSVSCKNCALGCILGYNPDTEVVCHHKNVLMAANRVKYALDMGDYVLFDHNSDIIESLPKLFKWETSQHV